MIEAIRYKPGYRLEVIRLVNPRFDSLDEGPIEIMLRMPPLPSVIDGKLIELVFRQQYLIEQLAEFPDRELVELVRSNIIFAWEMHEADEWLTYHGKQVHNPHQ